MAEARAVVTVTAAAAIEAGMHPEGVAPAIGEAATLQAVVAAEVVGTAPSAAVTAEADGARALPYAESSSSPLQPNLAEGALPNQRQPICTRFVHTPCASNFSCALFLA
jgi:hypothetical protein